MPDRCIFCQRNETLTREHIIPDWASEEMRRRDPSLTFRTESLWAPQGYTGRRMDVAPRIVCSPCNSGWMSDLETDVRPFVARAMRGQRQTLSRRRQALLATWAVVKMMSAENLAAADRAPYFTQGERSTLLRTKKPPEGLFVWTGRSVTNGAGWAQDQDIKWTGDDGTVVRGYSVLFQIDQFVVMLLAHRFRLGMRFKSVSLPIGFTPAAQQVWPTVRQALWPPHMAFGPESIQAWFDWWVTDQAMPQVDVVPGRAAWDQSRGTGKRNG